MGSWCDIRMTAGTAVLLLAALALGGCSSSSSEEPDRPESTGSGALSSPSTSPSAGPTPSPTPSPSGPTTATPPEQRPTRYRPSSAEVDGAAKLAAARAVEALPEVERVTYTQYFGYLPPLASILVEADFAGGGGTTYDVQISQSGGRWRVDSLEAARQVPPLAEPGPLIRRVLTSDRIELPWGGKVDVAAGRISDTVLRSMLAVSEEHRIGISVLISAHPVQVFGTDRRSNHPDGLAYDIGRIDGRLVVDPRAAGLVRDVMQNAAGTGAYQVGGPTDLDAGGSQYFSDVTHSEHVHAGFDR